VGPSPLVTLTLAWTALPLTTPPGAPIATTAVRAAGTGARAGGTVPEAGGPQISILGDSVR